MSRIRASCVGTRSSRPASDFEVLAAHEHETSLALTLVLSLEQNHLLPIFRYAQKKADEMKAISLQSALDTVESLEIKLTDFAKKHQNEIQNDPVFRQRFLQMCAPLGVDPLQASKKSFWGQLLGMGDFYHELAVKVAEVRLIVQGSSDLDGFPGSPLTILCFVTSHKTQRFASRVEVGMEALLVLPKYKRYWPNAKRAWERPPRRTKKYPKQILP